MPHHAFLCARYATPTAVVCLLAMQANARGGSGRGCAQLVAAAWRGSNRRVYHRRLDCCWTPWAWRRRRCGASVVSCGRQLGLHIAQLELACVSTVTLAHTDVQGHGGRPQLVDALGRDITPKPLATKPTAHAAQQANAGRSAGLLAANAGRNVRSLAASVGAASDSGSERDGAWAAVARAVPPAAAASVPPPPPPPLDKPLNCDAAFGCRHERSGAHGGHDVGRRR